MNKKTIISAIAAAALSITALIPCPAALAAGYKQGDVDKSGSVTAEDARIALRAAVKLQTLTSEAKALADVDFSGSVTQEDSRMILRSVVGLEKLPEPHKHSFTKAEPKSEDGTLTDYHYLVCECGERKQEKHSFETIVSMEPTCTRTGLAYDKCTVCGLQTGLKATPAQHKYEVTSVEPETCTTDGRRNKTCTVCGKTAAEIIPMTHVPGAAATCTKGQTCERCGEELTPALGHVFPDKVSVQLTEGITCPRCEKIIVHSFNSMVNGLKDGSHSFSKIEATVSTFNEPKFTGIMKDVKFLFESEFKDQVGTTTEYSPVERNRLLTQDNFNLIGSDKVSELKTSDISSIVTKRIKGVDFLPGLPDVIKTESGKEYDVSDIKAAAPGYVYKVTVTLKPERYSELKNKGGVDQIGRIFSGYDEIVGSIGDELNSVDFDDLLPGMKMEGDMVSTMTVSYYFADKTFEPLAAYYDIYMNMDQAMNLYEDESLTDLAGAIKFNIGTGMRSYFMFDGLFK